MPEVKQNFTRGLMDLGTDDRLMQPGYGRYFRNVDILGSESSDQGVVQNIRGNTSRGRNFDVPIDGPITLGAVTNPSNDKIYYFWVSRTNEGIYEYDPNLIDPVTGGGSLVRIVEFTKNDIESTSFLNFDVNTPITGAVVVGDLLIWTDGINPVRKINIERFRGSGNYHRCPIDSEGNQVCATGTIQPDDNDTRIEKVFLKSDINPQYDGQGKLLVSLSTDSQELDDIQLYSNIFAGDLINLAKRPPLFPPSITRIVDGITDTDYNGKGAQAEDKLFDTLPRFAIRYRYTDGETSAISPFSAPAFIPRKYNINTETGIMECMTNFMDKVDITFDIGEQEVKEIDIVYKESDSSTIYLVETINKEDIYTDADGNVGNSNQDGFTSLASKSSSAVKRQEFTYEYDGGKIYRALPSSELARIYDNVPITAKALTMAGNRLVLGNFVENYTFTRNNEDGEEINPRFDVDFVHEEREDDNVYPFRTLKTGRDYQVGIVYLDREGRQSPVIVSDNNTIHIPYSESGGRNRLTMTIKHEAPYWASHYRPFIKQSKGVFYNIIPKFAKFLHRDGSGENDPIVNQYYLNIHENDINKANVGDILVRKISAGEILYPFEYWRVVESKRLLKSTAFNLNISDRTPENVLPSNISDAHAGYYLILAPIDGDGNPLVDGEVDFPASDETDTTQFETVWETIPADNVGDFYWETFETYRCLNGRHTNANIEIPRTDSDIQLLDGEGRAKEGDEGSVRLNINWFNCYGYGNGIESMVVEDRFNAPVLDQGARASTIQENFEQYKKESWLIHSGVYVDSTNLNRLNEFNVSLPLQKELDVNDGSIQKLHFRDTNLYVFQENKVKNVPINKNVIITADGGALTTGGSQFFGVERSYAGEYGIAQNPESFATYGNRIYFADKNKGAILRLSNDGITEISKNGVEAYVRKYIAQAHFIKLFYNDYSDELDISFQNRYELPDFKSNRRVRRLSVQWGAADDICRAKIDGLDFEDVYCVMHEPGELDDNTALFIKGDVIFKDSDYKVPLNGDYRHYRVESGSGNSATYDQVIQISRDGVVVDVVESCRNTFGYRYEHNYFTISSEAFQSEVDACANAVIDQVAYFGPGTDQDPFELAAEPQEGNFIYESYRTLVRTDRTGWFKINVGIFNEDENELEYTNYVILINNGKVIKVFNCDRIEKGRVKFTGSDTLDKITGEPSFDKNLRICTANRDQTWWLDNERAEPLEGDVVYENNFTDEFSGAGYIALTDGRYLDVNSSGVIISIGSCSELVCSNEPYKYFVPNNELPLNTEPAATYQSKGARDITFRVSGLADLKLNDYFEREFTDNIAVRLEGDDTDTNVRTLNLTHEINSTDVSDITVTQKTLDDDDATPVAFTETFTIGDDSKSIVYSADLDAADYAVTYPSKEAGEKVYRVGGVSSGAVCTLGDDNCSAVLLNDISSIDQAAIEDNDIVSVRLEKTVGETVTAYRAVGRFEVADGNYDLILDNEGGSIEDEDSATYKVTEISNKYKYKFLGLEIETTVGSETREILIGLPEVTLNWIEKGIKTYPKLGTYETKLEGYSDIGVEELLNYKIKNEEEVPTELLVEPVLTELCYDKVTGGNETTVWYYGTTSYATEDAAIASDGPCELDTTGSLFYNPDVVPKQYYTNSSLDEDTLFDGQDRWWGVAFDGDDDNPNVTHIEQIDGSGRVMASKTINCGFKDKITLAFIPVEDEGMYNAPGDGVCMVYDASADNRVVYWANNSDWAVGGVDTDTGDDITTLRLRNGLDTIAPDGWYSTDNNWRRMTNGVLENDHHACPTQFSSVTLRYSSTSGKEACTSSNMQSVFSSTGNTNLSNIIKLYGDQYGASNAPGGFYSNGTLTGEWNRQTGTFSYAFCENNSNIDAPPDDIPPESEPGGGDPGNSGPSCTHARVSGGYRNGSDAKSACESTSLSYRYFNSNREPLEGVTYTDCFGRSEISDGWYANGNLVAQYSSGTWSNEQQCEVTPETLYEPVNLDYGNTAAAACQTGSSQTSYAVEGTGFSSGNTFYSSSDGGTLFSTDFSFASDGSSYATISGGTLGTLTSCPVVPPAVNSTGYNLSRAGSSANACKLKNNQTYYSNATSFSNTNSFYTDSALTSIGDSGYYSDGSNWRYFNGSSVTSSGGCTSANIVVDGAKHGSTYTQTITTGGATISGNVELSTGSPKTLHLSATAVLKNCPSGLQNYVAVGVSDISLTFDGVHGQVATYGCDHSLNGSSSAYKYNTTTGGGFTVSITNDDWAALGAAVYLTINLTVS